MTRYKIFHTVCTFALTSLLLNACVTAKKINYMQEHVQNHSSYDTNVSFNDYTLKINDKLKIDVYSTDETLNKLMNTSYRNNSESDLYTYTINENGNIKYPFVGEITLLGLTTRQAGHLIADSLKTFLQDMSSNIFVEIRLVSKYFSIVGIQNGRYPISKEKMTIFEGLALAGDITEFGDRANIKILRETNGETKIKSFDIRSSEIINSEFYYIEPNDIIYIKPIRGRAFGINSASSALIVASSTLSFGMLIYSIIQTSINRSKNK